MEDKLKSTTHEAPTDFVAVGKGVYISPKAFGCINKPGLKMEFFVETVTVNVGIGKDHTGTLVMPKDAWEALNAGEEIKTMTLKDFLGSVKPKRKKNV